MAFYNHPTRMAGSPYIQAILNQPPSGSYAETWGNRGFPSTIYLSSRFDIETTRIKIQQAREAEQRREESEPWLRAQERMRHERAREDRGKEFRMIEMIHKKIKRRQEITRKDRFLLAEVALKKAQTVYVEAKKKMEAEERGEESEDEAEEIQEDGEEEDEAEIKEEDEEEAEDEEDEDDDDDSSDEEESLMAIHRRELAKSERLHRQSRIKASTQWQIFHFVISIPAIVYSMLYLPFLGFLYQIRPFLTRARRSLTDRRCLLVRGVRQFTTCPEGFRYCPCGPFKRTHWFLSRNPWLMPALIIWLVMVYWRRLLELTLVLVSWCLQTVAVVGFGWLAADMVARKMK
ncbi:MAG: hypothetical protein L6R41_005833 [Letrouitia leprolyta]|nr:MAG: hypothetical protein L6R41_005833 [Letrouitia leprolyta]